MVAATTHAPNAEAGGAGRGTRTRRRAGVRAVLGVAAALLVAVAVWAALLASSVSQAQATGTALQRDAARVEAGLRALNLDAVSEATDALAGELSDLAGNLDGWVWAPVALTSHDDDLAGARELVAVGQELVSGALQPVVEAVRPYLDVSSAEDALALIADGTLDSTAQTIDAAESCVRDAQGRLDALPSFQVEQLGEAADELRDVLGQVGELLDRYDEARQEVQDAAAGVRGFVDDAKTAVTSGAQDLAQKLRGLFADEE